MNPALEAIKQSIETAEQRAREQTPDLDVPYGVEWEFNHAMRIAGEAGFLKAAAKMAVAYAEMRDAEIADLKETIAYMEEQARIDSLAARIDHVYEMGRA